MVSHTLSAATFARRISQGLKVDIRFRPKIKLDIVQGFRPKRHQIEFFRERLVNDTRRKNCIWVNWVSKRRCTHTRAHTHMHARTRTHAYSSWGGGYPYLVYRSFRRIEKTKHCDGGENENEVDTRPLQSWKTVECWRLIVYFLRKYSMFLSSWRLDLAQLQIFRGRTSFIVVDTNEKCHYVKEALSISLIK